MRYSELSILWLEDGINFWNYVPLGVWIFANSLFWSLGQVCSHQFRGVFCACYYFSLSSSRLLIGGESTWNSAAVYLFPVSSVISIVLILITKLKVRLLVCAWGRTVNFVILYSCNLRSNSFSLIFIYWTLKLSDLYSSSSEACISIKFSAWPKASFLQSPSPSRLQYI